MNEQLTKPQNVWFHNRFSSRRITGRSSCRSRVGDG